MQAPGLTLSTSARFCRLLLKGSRVRHETTTNSRCRQRKMAASTMALASRGSVEMWARRCPRVVRYSRWSRTPASSAVSPALESHSAAWPSRAPLTNLLEQDHGLVHRLDVWTVYGLGEELHCLQRERGRASVSLHPICAPPGPPPTRGAELPHHPQDGAGGLLDLLRTTPARLHRGQSKITDFHRQAFMEKYISMLVKDTSLEGRSRSS